jgi:hypothetical protein
MLADLLPLRGGFISLLRTRRIIVRLLGILVVVGLFAFLGFQLWHNHVDQSNPDAVARAFVKAIKGENMKRAATLWVPAEAEAWRAGAEKDLNSRSGNGHIEFINGLPGNPVFVSSRAPKMPENEQIMKAGDLSLNLRQIEGKWYVCKGPL